MTPPPSAALVLLGAWVGLLFVTTNVAASHQRRTTDPTEIRTPVDRSADRPSEPTGGSLERSSARDGAARSGATREDGSRRARTRGEDSRADSRGDGRESVGLVADD